MSDTPILALENAEKSYGAVRALREGTLVAPRRRGPRAGGGERRRQVHAS